MKPRRNVKAMDVYPLIFDPILKPKIWGGQRLKSLLNKNLPTNETIGESWELADLEEDQSVVAQGSAKGKTLGALIKEWGTDLLGRAELFENRFPLLIKFLDAQESLSVQVHPDEATARRLGGTVRVKNEVWYVLEAKADAYIYRGLQSGIDAAALQQAIAQDRVESVLQRLPVKKGHCYYLPSGTIHALGAGVVVAEVQTPSDVTYRVYDWDRVDPSTGARRELHLSEALGCISYDTSPIPGETPEHVASVWTGVRPFLYVNGVRQSVFLFVNEDFQFSPTGGPFSDTTGITIGATLHSTGPSRVFNGTIDEVRFSNVARYDRDFTPVGRFQPDKHTIALYHFDEGEGTRAADASGNGHHASIHGARWIKVQGQNELGR